MSSPASHALRGELLHSSSQDLFFLSSLACFVFTPQGLPEASENSWKTLWRVFLHILSSSRLWATVGAILGMSGIRIAPSPHDGLGHAFSSSACHSRSPAHGGEPERGTDPPRHTQDIWRTVSEDSASHVCQTGECVFRGNTATSSDNAAVRGGCHVWSRRRFFAVGQDIDLPTRPVLSTTHVMFVCQSRPDRVSSLDTHA